MVRVVWAKLISFDLQPQIHKNSGAHSIGMDIVMLKYSHNWYPLQNSKLQAKAEFTETCPLADWCPAILSFQTGMDATLLNYMCLGVCGLLSPSSGVPV